MREGKCMEEETYLNAGGLGDKALMAFITVAAFAFFLWFCFLASIINKREAAR